MSRRVHIDVDEAEPNWDHVLHTIRGSHNTLMGWLRQMDGYDDDAMILALKAAWHRPDGRRALVERMAAYYAAEARAYAGEGERE